MLLRELFVSHTPILIEGGNLEIDGHRAQHIDLKVHDRKFIVPVLNQLLQSINSTYHSSFKQPLWSPELLQSQKFLSGSSLHFFNTDISDAEFVQKKPKVGDIDTQVNKEARPNIEQFLKSSYGKQIGPAKFIGYKLGNEQFSTLWEMQNPPIKVQIDLEFVEYNKDTNEPTDWAQFSHSSSWEDLSQGVKGVFHKYFMRALTSGTISQKYIQMKTKIKGPITDNDVSFAVSSKQGGGMRRAYEPVIDPETNQPKEINGIPLVREIPTSQSHYEQSLSKQFEMLFGQQPDEQSLKLLWSFIGGLDLANQYLDDNARQQVADSFIKLLYGPGAQGLYKGDAERDAAEKGVAFNLLISKLKMPNPEAIKTQANQLAKEYYTKYKTNVNINEAEVKAQLRKGMPHLRDLKPADLLDLLDEIHDGNGRFKLQNIPLNVKVDGFGGRFGKDAEGRPFMGTSNRPPRYDANFLKYHQEKGTEDPDVLYRAQLFDSLFDEMMSAVKIVDSKLGPKFLINKQVVCEVLYLPFATETPEGRLKFVGIHYDKLPEGVQLALVPFRVVDATTGEDLPDATQVVKKLTGLGKQGSVMFIDNSLTQNEALDVTAIVPPLENIEQIKAMLASGKLAQKREAKEILAPVAVALEDAIIKDPNIVGKDMLGKDYEGIVLNTRLGPVKVTSPEQKKVIADKNAAQKAARQEQPRGQSKTAVVAIGSFVGHKGHEQLWQYTRDKAAEVGGDPYLFIGNAVGKDDPIPPNVKAQTWHKLYPEWANNISTVMQGGQIIQKIKHELINPLPGKPPRYDNIIIMVGEDQANMNIANALMKAVNKFQGYEHVKVTLEPTPRGTGIKFTNLRKILSDPNATPEQQLALWERDFDVAKLGKDWIKHLMDLTKQGMGLPINIKQANKVIREMRAQEFTRKPLAEGDIPADLNRLPNKSVTAAIKGGLSIPGISINKANGSPYQGYRFGIAMAGADGKGNNPTPAAGAIAGDPLLSVYTQEEYDMVKQAAKDVMAGPIKKLSSMNSEEVSDVNKTSPVAKPKRNKYGI
jgi:hypothetical protein